ncbi:seipin co-factor family protein [Aspergillus undulatus]|uniref:seipin co-factor family protein n=1 Tax=Aspergillus undulatus TaxID=1810928 RepID=UPI003CCE25B7
MWGSTRMTLNTVTSGVSAAGAPVSQVTDTAQNTVNQTAGTAQKTVSDASSSLPGTFPKDEPPTSQKNNVTMPSFTEMWSNFIAWLKGLVPRGIDVFEAAVRRFVNWLLPPERQAAIYKASVEHPIASTFVIAQLICVGIPFVLFVAGTLLFAAVAMLVWALLSILILGPIVLVASLMGVSLWGWGWFVFGLVRWLDKLVLGGMMERFWKARYQEQKAEEEAKEPKGTNEEKRDG